MQPTISSLQIATAAAPVAIVDLPLTAEQAERLPRLGQVDIHVGGASTDLMVEAARLTLELSGRKPHDIALVISAPSLLTEHGLIIPAAAVRARLGLKNADILNIQQGCVGVLKALELGADRLRARPGEGDILVVAGCMASTLTVNSTHGAFFWSDGAGAALVTSDDTPGFVMEAFAEAVADTGYDAMTVPFGDGGQADLADPAQSRIKVTFSGAREQMAYIDREAKLFGAVLDRLLIAAKVAEDAIDGLILPATGANRVPTLLGSRPALSRKVVTDFRRGHMGGVDILIELQRSWNDGVADGALLAALMPAFTTEWGGALLRCRR